MRLHLVILFFIFLLPQITIAKVYRCTDSSGNVSYSQQPCSGAAKSREMDIGGSASLGEASSTDVCREVALMAQGLYPSVRDRKDVSHVFDDLGGLGSLSSATVNIVNYTASFRFNKTVSASKVGSLSYKRCKRNGFGRITERDLPDWNRVGGHSLDPEIRQQIMRNRHHTSNRNQLSQICNKYDKMLEIIDKRMAAPMDELEKTKLAAEREMIFATRAENCK